MLTSLGKRHKDLTKTGLDKTNRVCYNVYTTTEEDKTMKKVVVAVVVMMMMVCTCACAEMYPELYIVTEVNHEQDIVVLLDGRGEVWVWEGAEDWFPGDLAVGIVEDWDTPDLYDDEILTLRCCNIFESVFN